MDYDHKALQLAREITRQHAGGPIIWVSAKAEEVPLPDECVDHLICRGVLQLTDVPRTVSEIGRLVREGGTVFLLLHSWRFYVGQVSLDPRSWRKTALAMSVIASSLFFNLTGKLLSPRLGRWRITESFQTVGRMRKLLASHGLRIDRVVKNPEFLMYATKTGR
jgi:ubiquinone/menaquinone biosynthesis C-methylase UbiE